MEDTSADMSLNDCMDDMHSFLDIELEALQSIYINEIDVQVDSGSTTVQIDLHPATADKLDEQYVRITLQFLLQEGYPEDIPQIKIRNPRGLSEEKLNCIEKDLVAIAENKKGNSMLFEMIEAAKEHLTTGNRPSGECAICLCVFSDHDVFTKTECYHYFHSHCLARYTKNFKENSEDNKTDPKNKSVSNELLCPMCRIPIKFYGSVDDYQPPETNEDSFVLTTEMLELQKRMADLYQKQVEKGGIIDIEAEKNKYLIEISNVPTRVNMEEKPEHKLTAQDDSVLEENTESPDHVNSPSKERREYNRDRNHRPDYRGKNRNYNRVNESRGGYRYDRGYNKQSYDSRGKYNRNKYDKNYQRFEKSNYANYHKGSEDSNEVPKNVENPEISPLDSAEREDWTGSTSPCENAVSETSDQPSPDMKGRYNSGSAPRYNRGYRRGNNYGSNYRYGRGRRSDYSDFPEQPNSHKFQKHSSASNEDQYTHKSEDNGQEDIRTSDGGARKQNYRFDNYRRDDFASNGGARKPNYRSDNFRRDNDFTSDGTARKQNYRSDNFRRDDFSSDGARKQNYRPDNIRRDNDFYSRERHTDSRNSQRGGRVGYGRRGNYSHESNYSHENKYSYENKYVDSKEDQYSERDKKNSGPDRYKSYNTHDYTKSSSRNYAGNRYEKRTDEHSHSKDERQESVDPSSRSPSSESNNHLVENESLDCLSGNKRSESKNKEKFIPHFTKNCSDKLTENAPADENGLSIPPSFCENPQGSLQTAIKPPPGFANPLKKVIYGLQGANPPPGFHRS